MAIKPQPMLIHCKQCGWKSAFAPASDALVELPPEQCPKCHNPDLDSRPANALEKAALKLGEILQPRRLLPRRDACCRHSSANSNSRRARWPASVTQARLAGMSISDDFLDLLSDAGRELSSLGKELRSIGRQSLDEIRQDPERYLQDSVRDRRLSNYRLSHAFS